MVNQSKHEPPNAYTATTLTVSVFSVLSRFVRLCLNDNWRYTSPLWCWEYRCHMSTDEIQDVICHGCVPVNIQSHIDDCREAQSYRYTSQVNANKICIFCSLFTWLIFNLMCLFLHFIKNAYQLKRGQMTWNFEKS